MVRVVLDTNVRRGQTQCTDWVFDFETCGSASPKNIEVEEGIAMTLTLEIPPDIQRKLAREAEARGVAIPVLAVRLLEEAVARPTAATPAPAGRSPMQIRAWLDSLAEFSDQIPALPGETFSPSMIYHDPD